MKEDNVECDGTNVCMYVCKSKQDDLIRCVKCDKSDFTKNVQHLSIYTISAEIVSHELKKYFFCLVMFETFLFFVLFFLLGPRNPVSWIISIRLHGKQFLFLSFFLHLFCFPSFFFLIQKSTIMFSVLSRYYCNFSRV